MKKLVLLVIALYAYDTEAACDIENASALPPVVINVGMFNAIWHGGNYRAAAYAKLANTLETFHGSAPPGVYAVPFTYTVNFLGWSATHSVTLCLQKNLNQDWEDAVDDLLASIQQNTPIFALEEEGFEGAFDYSYSDYLMSQVFDANLTFPAGATIFVGGAPRGIVECKPVCF